MTASRCRAANPPRRRRGSMRIPAGFLLAALCMASVSPEAKAAATFFVSDSGSDQASGDTVGHAWATLANALKRALSMPPAEQVTIAVLPGEYRDQHVRLKWPSAAPGITVRAFDPASPPSFDGSGKGAWLIVEALDGPRHLGLTIEGLHVRSYQTAISLNGNGNEEGSFLSDVTIADNRFERIGSRLPGQDPSTAAIRLVNARDITVVRNDFISIVNDQQCGLLHAIYLAHHSSSNLIDGNTFRDGCGATVKVRDDSSGNRIIDNRFEKQRGKALLLDAFCDLSNRPECAQQECPSWANLFARNTDDGSAPRVRVTGPDVAPTCPPAGNRARVAP